MHLVKFAVPDQGHPQVGLLDADRVRPLQGVASLSDVLHAAEPERFATERLGSADLDLALDGVRLLAPIDDQEVWGAGVTYQRSKEAREEESEQGGSFYDLVYRADRPELFFKATPNRVVGPLGSIRVRRDTRWCVPEPELALVLNPDLKLVGFTIGNDVSARDIEGRNPLYLPQAKLYDACCALGPGITLASAMPAPAEIAIDLRIERDAKTIVEATTSVGRMARSFAELIDWLGRDNVFPRGVVLLTGTGIVPPDEFSLLPGDTVHISINGIGTLTNSVVQGPTIE